MLEAYECILPPYDVAVEPVDGVRQDLSLLTLFHSSLSVEWPDTETSLSMRTPWVEPLTDTARLKSLDKDSVSSSVRV